MFRPLILSCTAFVPEISTNGGKSQNKEFAATFTAANESTRPLRAQSDKGPTLDSFETVMRAMDAELARSRSGQSIPLGQDDGKGKGKESTTSFNSDIDIETAMDAELQQNLKRGGDDDENLDIDGETDVDYELIKNFLESFKSQGGVSGPVSNLVGRLQSGWAFPRDTS